MSTNEPTNMLIDMQPNRSYYPSVKRVTRREVYCGGTASVNNNIVENPLPSSSSRNTNYQLSPKVFSKENLYHLKMGETATSMPFQNYIVHKLWKILSENRHELKNQVIRILGERSLDELIRNIPRATYVVKHFFNL